MTASPDIAHRMREEIDEVYTFEKMHSRLGYDISQATVQVSYEEDGRATVILHDMPGVSGYYINYPGVVEGDEKKEREYELAHELVDFAMDLLDDYSPKKSSWTSNSGNRSLRDIYVEVDEQEIDQVIILMYQILHRFNSEYIEFLEKYEPEEIVEPTATLEEKVQEIIGSSQGPVRLNSTASETQ